ncbi:alcohol oxidase [Aureobasidium subglaciale]|nr:alcohol oxidase [Aureobasidium subglaciale]
MISKIPDGQGEGLYGIDNACNSLPALCACARGFLSETYDFIVIGGGTAGLTIAARLTEDPDIVVGVLEAGKSRLDDPLVDTPATFPQLLGNPDYDYGYKSVPQEIAELFIICAEEKLLVGRVLSITCCQLLQVRRAQTNIDADMKSYVRGSDADYDDWATLVGDSSWSSKALKPYMRKHQTLDPLDESISDHTDYPHVGKNHGTRGPVHTSFNDSSFPINDLAIKAMDEVAGLSKKPTDPWSGDHIGFFNTLGAVARSGPHKGKRSYAARGYFEANACRPNLKVLCEAQVTKIVLEDGIAKGVEFVFDGMTETVYAKKEVILCGGVINSPQILELSGIGDPGILNAAGIECAVKLPDVGENLQDHACAIIGLDLKPGIITLDILGDPDTMEAATKALVEHQRGPLTAIASTQGFLAYKSHVSASELEITIQSIRETQSSSHASPFYKRQLEQVITHLESDKSANLQYIVIPAGADFENGIRTQKLWPPPDNDRAHRVTIASCLQYPVSRGSCHITSSDPTAYPRIDPAYLKHPADTSVLAAGLHFINNVTKSPHLAPLIQARSYPPLHRNLSNLSDCEEAVKDWVMGEYHLIGTCAMGEVVDSRLRVKGVKGLRVVDASVFPNHVSGNICSSVYMAAEKGGDLIKEDWGV